MRILNVRHPAVRCVAEALLDLFPSNADISEIGPETAPGLFVSWRTNGAANRPGNIAWGVHYRFEQEVLGLLGQPVGDACAQICERARQLSCHLQFDYADPDAVSLLIVDISADALRELPGLDLADAPRVP